MAALRLGATLRMAGLKDEAKLALDECARLVAKLSDPDSRDETKVELAREFWLLGDVDRAEALAAELTQREYDLLAHFVFARDAFEATNAQAAEKAIRRALSIAQKPGRKIDPRMGSSLLCALGRMAYRLERPELGRACEELIPDPVWKSALTGERALWLLSKDDWDEARKIAGQAVDPHMALLARARVESRLKISESAKSREARIDALIAASAKIKDSDQRDFALRVAAQQFATSADGDVGAATRIAQQIKHPAAKFLTLAPLIDATSFSKLMTLLDECAANDRPALAEVLAMSCGKLQLGSQALVASEQVPQGWPRVRALCDAAKFLKTDAARPLLTAAVAQLSNIKDSGWRCVARSQIALAAQRIGDNRTVESQLSTACRDALQIEALDDRRAVLPQVIEAALDGRQLELAARTLNEALQGKPDEALRDVLVPLLIEAGDADGALQEVATAPLENDFAKRFVAIRLAKAGRVMEAVKYASTLNNRARPEALCDIARTQLPNAAEQGYDGLPVRRHETDGLEVRRTKMCMSRRVALSLHGGWFYWPHRLERAGLDWDVMPFLTPYEEGNEGLAARYSLLGYPGAGDHLIQCSAFGVEQTRRYLRDGGGLFGICAGQLFATGHPNGHRFVPGDFYYLRGNGPHQVQMTERHPAAIGLPPQIIINRQNGDFMIPRPGCDVIGWYDNQNVCAAVMASRYGLGRVVVSSPHPEGDNSYSPTDRLCIEVTRWILEGTP
jgi:predicted negative regulator of RcsB-dependent stress response